MAPANSSLTKRCPTACDQPGSLAARKVSVKRSGMMLVPAEDFDHQDSVLMKLPRSEKSLSRLTLRSTPPTKEALLSTSTAPSWGRRPPGPERRVWGGV